jgi:hypothetical protein
MPAPKNLQELAAVLEVSEDRAKSVLFRVVDFLLAAPPPDAAVENGMWHLPKMVGEKQFIDAYQETLWAAYEIAVGETPDKKMWVNIGPSGINVTIGR